MIDKISVDRRGGKNVYFFERYGLEEKDFFRSARLTDTNFPVHFHRAYELIIVEEGETLLMIEEKEYRIKKGEGVFIFPNQMHAFKSCGHSILKIIIFSPELIRHFFDIYKELIPQNPFFPVADLPMNQTFGTIYSQKSFLYQACDQLIKGTTFSSSTYSPQAKIIQKMIAYIDQHYAEDITLKEVSAGLQYDYAYLSKLFKQVTELSFTNYLNQYRISQACYLLNNGQKTVLEISLECGYQNLRTFHRNFKKITCVTPQQYKRSVNKEEQNRWKPETAQ